MAQQKITTDEEVGEHLRILDEFRTRVQTRQYRLTVIPFRFLSHITGAKDERLEKEEAKKRL